MCVRDSGVRPGTSKSGGVAVSFFMSVGLSVVDWLKLLVKEISAEQLFWTHWTNNLATKARRHEMVVSAVNLRNPANWWIGGPQTSCLPLAVAAHLRPSLLPVNLFVESMESRSVLQSGESAARPAKHVLFSRRSRSVFICSAWVLKFWFVPLRSVLGPCEFAGVRDHWSVVAFCLKNP